ncbi:MAG: pyruvate kinase [Chitinophagaceae bacterium]|nr:pyruvate kinase [Chitinophagaceae bacterium]
MIPNPLQEIQRQLTTYENKMLHEVEKRKKMLETIHIQQQAAAKNLIHYLTLRGEDICALQESLHIEGLSSLASSESHIHRQLQAVLQQLGTIYQPQELDECSFEYSSHQIREKSSQLFGQKTDTVIPFIMVTFDASFTDDDELIQKLLLVGMNVARINCAHDEESTWIRLIDQLKRACHKTGLSCKIYFDLAGPKIRTNLINKGSEKGKVKVKEGDLIWLAEETAGYDSDDIVISPNEPGIVAMLKKGERVYIDDGIIKGIIESNTKKGAALRLIRISSDKHQIKDGKGINFPDSDISIASLTDFDKACLPFICKHADMVGYSFVKNCTDLAELQQALLQITATPPNIILKIETPQAVKNLPGLLLRGMQQPVFGVMIARGDLAVEIGFERMGEIQEEILWICESAHVPVVWATQVLENLNKSGIATRSEITDAAHAAMAECVMINKGGHTVKVIETLKDILHRIAGHHIKKRFTFRQLSIAKNFMMVPVVD